MYHEPQFFFIFSLEWAMQCVSVLCILEYIIYILKSIVAYCLPAVTFKVPNPSFSSFRATDFIFVKQYTIPEVAKWLSWNVELYIDQSESKHRNSVRWIFTTHLKGGLLLFWKESAFNIPWFDQHSWARWSVGLAWVCLHKSVYTSGLRNVLLCDSIFFFLKI